MTSPRRALIASYILFWVVVLIAVEVIIITAANAKPSLEALQQAQNTEQSENPIVPEPAQEAPQNVSPEPSEAVDPVSTPTAPAHSTAPAQQQGAHIPFTSDPVTPGDPESYVDTVGQCPFYEMAGEKGCTPPPDIECSADWSECHPRQQ